MSNPIKIGDVVATRLAPEIPLMVCGFADGPWGHKRAYTSPLAEWTAHQCGRREVLFHDVCFSVDLIHYHDTPMA